MKKRIIALGVFATFALVGIGGNWVSASADSELQSIDDVGTYAAGEYEVGNFVIKRNWQRLSNEQKEWYIQNPQPSKFFPFGVDATAKYPKGFPDCKDATYAASYPATAKLPELCWVPGLPGVPFPGTD